MIFLNKIWNLFEKFLRFFLSLFFKCAKKELTDEIWCEFLRFVKFCVVGVSNTVISLSVYYGIVLINRNWYIFANTLGFIISVLNSYYWNSRFVFDKKDEVGKTVARTFLAYGFSLIFGNVLLYVFVEILQISEFLAPLINMVITTPFNYIINKKWAMKKND